MRRACLVPLDYSPGREEYSVIYISSEWEELEEILADPKAAMRCRQRMFREDRPVHDWRLKAPTTIFLEPLDGSREELTFEAAALLKGGSSLSDLSFNDAKMIVAEELPQGFIVNFALRTSLIRILYRPQQRKPHWRGYMATPTLSIANNSYGTLHLDIGSCNDDRAQFVMDYLEDRKRIADWVSARSDYTRAPATFVDPGSRLSIGQPIGAGSGYPLRRDTRIENPYFVIEGASVDDICCACVGLTVQVNGREGLLGSGYLKSYCDGKPCTGSIELGSTREENATTKD